VTVEFVTIQEIVQAARHNLKQGTWGYLSGGSESETTLRRNRLAFDQLAFRPRVLVDVSNIDTSSNLLGHSMRIPVVLAPVGSQQVFTPEGGAAATKAADEFGILDVISSVTEPSLEDIASVANNPKVFQLYLNGDWDWTKEMIARVKQAGYSALCITADTARPSRRDRTMLARWSPRDNFLGSSAPNKHQVSGGRNGGHASSVTGRQLARSGNWLVFHSCLRALQQQRTLFWRWNTAPTRSGYQTTVAANWITDSEQWKLSLKLLMRWQAEQPSSWMEASSAAAMC